MVRSGLWAAYTVAPACVVAGEAIGVLAHPFERFVELECRMEMKRRNSAQCGLVNGEVPLENIAKVVGCERHENGDVVCESGGDANEVSAEVEPGLARHY